MWIYYESGRKIYEDIVPCKNDQETLAINWWITKVRGQLGFLLNFISIKVQHDEQNLTRKTLSFMDSQYLPICTDCQYI